MQRAATGVFSALLVFLLFQTGCGEGPIGPPGPPGRDAVGAFSFELDFRLREAAREGAVASVAYEVPALSRAVVEEGAVLAYFREQGTWTAMPYTYGVESSEVPAVDYTVTLGYAYEEAFLQVFYELSLDDEELLGSLPDQRIKIVVIEGVPPIRSTLDLSDYESVREHYGLAD